MQLRSFHLSAQGASHIKKNKECQDASTSYFDDAMAIAVVCDGHGGDDYVRSAIGSQYACEIAERNIRNFVENVDEEELKVSTDRLIATLEGSIIGDWNEAITAHYAENPFTEEEISVLSDKAKTRYLDKEKIESAYGTTLIAVVVTHSYWFGIHIGDGKCVAISPDGKFEQPIPWDSKCFLNATTSICDSDAINNFRYFFSEELPAAVFVGSDGVDDCFSNDDQLHNLYRTVLFSFSSTEFESAVNDLMDYLPRLSAKGSGDDVSVAAVLDLDSIGQIESVRDFDREKEKSRVEENARREAEKAEEERRRIEEEHRRIEEERKRAEEERKRVEEERRRAEEERRRVAEERRRAEEERRRVAEEQRRAEEARRRAEMERRKVRPAPFPRFCAYCGAPLHLGARFCGECGMRVVIKISKQPPAPLPPRPLPRAGNANPARDSGVADTEPRKPRAEEDLKAADPNVTDAPTPLPEPMPEEKEASVETQESE